MALAFIRLDTGASLLRLYHRQEVDTFIRVRHPVHEFHGLEVTQELLQTMCSNRSHPSAMASSLQKLLIQ